MCYRWHSRHSAAGRNRCNWHNRTTSQSLQPLFSESLERGRTRVSPQVGGRFQAVPHALIDTIGHRPIEFRASAVSLNGADGGRSAEGRVHGLPPRACEFNSWE